MIYSREQLSSNTGKGTDLFLLGIIVLVVYSVVLLGQHSLSPFVTNLSINLSVFALPYYALLSTERMAIAFILSIIFSLVYARIAVMNKHTEKFLIPFLDILQSIPILSFMPGVVLALVALFPHDNIGLELAAIILIFTSQAWNIAFGFYETLSTIPGELKDVAQITHLGIWQRFVKLELPSGVISLVWNSMMSWGGGWFFLMASEMFTLGNRNYELPGLGSYLQTAAYAGNIRALVYGIITLVSVIVLLDQVLWRPLVAWSEKFKLEQSESGSASTSMMLKIYQSSSLLRWIGGGVGSALSWIVARIPSPRHKTSGEFSAEHKKSFLRDYMLSFIAKLLIVIAGLAFLYGIFLSSRLLVQVDWAGWKAILLGSSATLARVAAALAFAMLWTIPVGVAIGLNSDMAKKIQPVIQVFASIPATAFFPIIIVLFLALPAGLNIAAIILMVLGAQWYVLFNVIAGAMAIPTDLKEAASIYNLKGVQRWRYLILPGIFPYLVTGMITAAGGAWNASIISEYVTYAGKVHDAVGLGATIARAANTNDIALLFASTVSMSLLVFVINRFFWKRLYTLAEQKYHIE